MTNDLRNEPAFPCAIEHAGIMNYPFPGLTKRELFAAMAMQGLLEGIEDSQTWAPDGMASHAVAYADALLAALDVSAKP